MDQEIHKTMTFLRANSLRELVEQVNQLGIQNEDIVSTIDMAGRMYLLYYN